MGWVLCPGPQRGCQWTAPFFFFIIKSKIQKYRNKKMKDIALTKEQKLREIFRDMGSCAIAFSGGVDSTYMLAVASEVLGENAAALTASSEFFPLREGSEAEEFCRKRGIRQIRLCVKELDIPGLAENPKDRCYICKKALFGKMLAIAEENGFAYLAEGSNMDDTGDYRPGLLAIAELSVRSPLREAGLYKAEIRERSKAMGLPTWSKPSFACLASRFVYGETITEEKLSMVDKAEQFLLDLGLSQMRVRIHGTMARIEALPRDIPYLASEPVREKITAHFKEIGFSYTALDLTGYRTGSMNEVL